MISSTLLFALAVGAARAALVPTAPGPGQSFNEGGDCTVSWNLDTTDKWTSFSVDLMSGSNQVMQPVTNVFKDRDGTKGDTTFTWKCPKVTPNSAIYFYQFTQPGADTTWTTRFTIASASGEVTPPANAAQPGGAAIPWGIGRLEGAGAPTSNQTDVKPPTSTTTTTTTSNTTSVTTPDLTSNSTNATTAALAGSTNSTVPTNGTIGITGPPKQPTSPTTTTSTTTRTGPATSNTATTSKPSTTAPTSDAALLVTSKAAMVTLAIVSLFIVA